MSKYQIIKFKENNIEINVNVSPTEETVWLTLNQMSELFGRDKSVINRHINSVYKDGELTKETTIAKNAMMLHGREYITFLYNLDVIISVGYRIKSPNGIVFRKWANKVLKEYLLKGYVINEQRTLITNENYVNLINKVNSIDSRLSRVEKINLEKEKIFFNGDMFDAKSFISNLISYADKSITLIDSYADIKALDFLKHKKSGVILSIYYSSKANLSKNDIDVFNNQYGSCTAKVNDKFHDRFLIIDDKDLYHLGASLNYAGKKAFAITKMDNQEILKLLKNNL